jgi:hypothetical protein
MRSFKGYCMRRARREVYKAFRNVNNTYANKNENTESDKFTWREARIFIMWILCEILFLKFLYQI